MTRINGRKLGVWSLRLDAAYCLVLGAFVASTAAGLTAVVALPEPLLFATGIVVALWSGLVLWMLSRLRIRLALGLVMGVNVVAATLISATVLTAATSLALIAMLVIAFEVALFAVSQAVAIRALGSVQPR